MGNGYKLAAITRIKGTFLQTITSQEEESECGAEKKELFSAKIHNPFSHIRPENVCSGCLCACGSMYFMTVRARECACGYDRASSQSCTLFTTRCNESLLFEVKITESYDNDNIYRHKRSVKKKSCDLHILP